MSFDKRNFMSARYDIFAIIALTLINSIMLISGSGTYMLFSAAIPYQFVLTGLVMSGRLEFDGYEVPVMGDIALYVALVMAVIILAVYLVLAILSTKHHGCLIAATVLFGIDTAYLLPSIASGGIIDVVFHIIIMVMLVRGCTSAKRYAQAFKYLEFVQANGMGIPPSNEQAPSSDNGYFNSNENGYFQNESSYFPQENAPQNNDNQNPTNSNDEKKNDGN